MKTMKTLPVPNHSRALAPVSFRSAAPARARQDPVSGRAGSPGPRFASWLVLLLLACLLQTHAGSLVWTNASGGTWGNPANWSPNQVPSPTDDAVIGADGTYVVTLDAAAAARSLSLGGLPLSSPPTE